MKLKAFINKLLKKRDESRTVKSETFGPREDGGKKIIVESMIPDLEEDVVFGEIDIHVKNEKIFSTKISSQAIKIGRDPYQSDIIIPEPIVSKYHCAMHAHGDYIFVKDNNSTNGIYFDNQKVSEIQLKNNDSFTLGKKGTVRIVFRKGGIE
jgi:hypothetical protein